MCISPKKCVCHFLIILQSCYFEYRMLACSRCDICISFSVHLKSTCYVCKGSSIGFFFYILNYPHRMVDKSALNENKSVSLFRNTGKTGLLPQYLSFISRIFPNQHFYTMEIGFFNLFLQYFQHIFLLWKRSNFSSWNIILIFRARNFDLLVCFAPVVTCAT